MNDFIKREDAITAVAEFLMGEALLDYADASDDIEDWKEIAVAILEDVPTIDAIVATEEYEWCTECKEYDQEKHCCPRWNRFIRKTVEELEEYYKPKQGKWILECDAEGEADNLYRCSECGCKYGCQEYDIPNYCPDCGADMKGADDETHY